MLLVKSRPASGFELTPVASPSVPYPLDHAGFENIMMNTVLEITIAIIKRKIALFKLNLNNCRANL